MKALIFCAGYGTRLGKITEKINKVMIPIAGYPVLEHIITHLRKQGVSDIMVNLYYRPKDIYEYFGDDLLYFYERELLGEYKTLNRLKPWFEGEQFVFCNGDTLTDVNIRAMAGTPRHPQNLPTVRAMDGKTYTGLTVAGPDFYELGPGCEFHFSHYWQDIGTPEGLKKAREYYEEK